MYSYPNNFIQNLVPCYLQRSCTRQYLAVMKCEINLGFSNGNFLMQFCQMMSLHFQKLCCGIMLMLALSGQQEVLWVTFSLVILTGKDHQKGSLQWYKKRARGERVAEVSVLKYSQRQSQGHVLFILFLYFPRFLQ